MSSHKYLLFAIALQKVINFSALENSTEDLWDIGTVVENGNTCPMQEKERKETKDRKKLSAIKYTTILLPTHTKIYQYIISA
jgi:hypothetical protein